MEITVTEKKMNVSEGGIDKGTLHCISESMAKNAKTMLENGKKFYGFAYDGEFESYIADMCDGDWHY